ncbi:hypothetical protein J5N97_027147 [Dioscorea zingiberensis]|uniref:Uncharacterized protein n=1 Tax=Dioscorea zingiberensis TaxID=325984 RepID=A0A9D5C4C1_9LILI|nr:hypothetical protein J5N97_027147 [Dioscorea zingiberensis]
MHVFRRTKGIKQGGACMVVTTYIYFPRACIYISLQKYYDRKVLKWVHGRVSMQTRPPYIYLSIAYGLGASESTINQYRHVVMGVAATDELKSEEC